MSEKYIDTNDMAAEFMHSLNRSDGGSRKKAPDSCPFSADAISYAFEELAPDARQNVEGHIESCRVCMNLVLDVRAADIESQAQATQLEEVLPALADALDRPPKTFFVEMLAAGFNWSFMTLKIVAAPVAVICFMFLLANLNVLDSINPPAVKTETAERPHFIAKKTSPAPVARKKRTGSSTPTPQQEPSTINSFSMHEGWSTDPFEPALNHKPERMARHKAKAKRLSGSPLEKLDLSQLRLVGVMLSDKGNTALVEDASGKGYVIREGTYIGINAGKVTRILIDRVVVAEEIEDVHGNLISQKSVIKLQKP